MSRPAPTSSTIKQLKQRYSESKAPAEQAAILLEWADRIREDGALQEAVDLLQRGIWHLQDEPPPTPEDEPPQPFPVKPPPEQVDKYLLLSHLYLCLSEVLEDLAEDERATKECQRALILAARVGISAYMGRCLGRTVRLLTRQGRTRAADAHLSSLLVLGARMMAEGTVADQARLRLEEARTLLEVGRLDEVQRLSRMAAELANGVGQTPLATEAELVRLWLDWILGQAAEVLPRAERLRDQARRRGDKGTEIEAWLLAATSELHGGRAADGLGRISSVVDWLTTVRRGPKLRRARTLAAEGFLLAGSWQQARRWAKQALAGSEPAPSLFRLLPALVQAEACLTGIMAPEAERASLREGQELLDEAVDLIHGVQQVGHRFELLMLRAERIGALLQAESGELNLAIDRLEGALEEARFLSARLEEARLLLALARLKKRTGASKEAWKRAGEARQLSGELGAASLSAEIARFEETDASRPPPRLSQPGATAAVDAAEALLGATQQVSYLLEVGRAVSSILELKPLLERIMDVIIEMVKAERGFLMLFHQPPGLEDPVSYGEGLLEVRVARGMGKTDVEDPEFKVSDSVVAEVVEHGEPLLVSGAKNDPRFKEKASVILLSLNSILCFPLKSSRAFHGVIYVENRALEGLFGPEHLNLMLPFAAQAAQAIENARAYERIKELYDETLSVARAREKIVNHISHELRTPIAILKGVFGTIARRVEMTERLERTLDRGNRNLERLIELQGAITDIYQGKLEVLPSEEILEAINLQEVVEQLVREVEEEAPERDLELVVHAEPFLMVKAARKPLADGIKGLLRNAIENTPDEGRIEVTARGLQAGSAELSVKDYGVGITQTSQAHIFDGFYHTQETANYSSRRPYQFDAGGKGLELLRLKTFSDRFGWGLSFDSVRCGFIPKDSDVCPGRISACSHCLSRDFCLESGYTEFRLTLPRAPQE